MSQGQRRHIPSWLRRLRGWQEAPDWLLELIHRESGFSFVELGTRPEEAGFAPAEGLAADDETELSAALEWERAEARPDAHAIEEGEAASKADFPEQEEGVGPAPPPRRSGVTDWLLELEDDRPAEEGDLPPAEMRERSDWTDEWEERASETTGLGIEPGPEEGEAVPPARRSGITDWLTRLEDEPSETAGVRPQPSATMPEQPAADEDQAVAGESGDMPDWLTDLQAPVPEEGVVEGEVAGEVPDWLADLEAGPTGEEELLADRETGLPPWLTALEGDEPEKDVPEWLADLDSGGGIAAWLSEQQEEGARPPGAADQAEGGEAPEEAAEPERPGSSAGLDQAALEEVGLQEDRLPDWLRAFEDTTEDQQAALPEVTTAEPPEDQAPDWLRALEDTTADQQAVLPKETPAEVPQDEAPDWLHAIEETTDDRQPALEQGAEIADWLADQGQVAEDQEPGPAQEPVPSGEPVSAPTEDETPDWLRALDEVAEDRASGFPEEAAAELVEDETPDWLRDLGKAAEEQELPLEQEPAPSAGAAKELAEGETPNWLRDLDEIIEDQRSDAEPEADALGDVEQAEPVSIEPVTAPGKPDSSDVEEAVSDEEMPDWLRDLALDEREPEADLGPEAGAPMPDWLSLEGMPSTSAVVPEGQEEEEPEEPAPPVPEWMEGIYTPQEEPPEGEEALSLPPAEEWANGEVPGWLASLEDEGTGPARQVSAVEASGPLAGLSGVLSPEPILADFPKSAFQPVPPVPDAHQAEAELVERALETPASRRIQVSHATGREILNSLGRWVIYGLLLAAVLFAPLRSCVRLPDFGETRTFRNAIERLPSGSAVLIVFDYDASLDGTLTPQARAILWHLQRRDLGIVLLSLTPQGAAIAEDLIAEREGMVAGRDYVDLGYLPPHPASLLAFMGNPLGGVARFGTTEDPAATVLGRQVRTFSDLDMIVTITGDRDHIRWWIEQVQPRAEIELLAAVPAAITPYVEPYYSELGTGQIAGVLGGLGPTAQYEEMIGADFLPSARLSYVVQTNALLLFTGVVLVSGLGSLLGSLSRRGAPGKARGSAGEVDR
jgi:hypothetical protein